MHEWFKIPEEDEHFPDIKCGYCGAMVRWCPYCKGYHHHKEHELWITNHWHGEVVSETGDMNSLFPLRRDRPVTFEEYIQALTEAKEKREANE